ncbi:hypothetical protein ACFQ2B_39255 [Streptomyces stramineus]
MVASDFLNPHLLTALTLIAVGRTRKQAAEAMGIKQTTLTSYFATAATTLGCAPRMPLLVHRAYGHPAFPTPARVSAPAPVLVPNEWMVLLAHTGGITLQHLSGSRMLSLDSLTRINRSLMAKLKAETPAHSVRRAWQYALLPGTDSPTASTTRPGAGGQAS